MNTLSNESKNLHDAMMGILRDRGGEYGCRYENGVPLLRIESSGDGMYWPVPFDSYYPPFQYSLDALNVIEKLLTNGEKKEYADKLRSAICGNNGGIMETLAEAQIASAKVRFDCLCEVLNLKFRASAVIEDDPSDDCLIKARTIIQREIEKGARFIALWRGGDYYFFDYAVSELSRPGATVFSLSACTDDLISELAQSLKNKAGGNAA